MLYSIRVNTTSGASRAKGIVIVNNERANGAELVSDLVPTVYGRLGVRTSGITCVFTSSLGKGSVPRVMSGLTNNFLIVRSTGRLSRRATSRLRRTVAKGAGKVVIVLRSRGVNVHGLVTECPGLTGGFASVVGVPMFAGSRLIGFTGICAVRGKFHVSRVNVLTLCGLVKVGRGRSRPVYVNAIGAVLSGTVRETRDKLFGHSGGHISHSNCAMLFRGSFD